MDKKNLADLRYLQILENNFDFKKTIKLTKM